jgi:hypothetical protein
MAKAIDLSLAEEQGAHRLDSPLSPLSPPERQCPVCDDYLVLSEVEFKQHIDRCLDEDYDTPVLPTTTDSTTVPAWRQLIQSIPTAIQDTLIGKVTASSVTNDHDNAMTISSNKESKPVPDYKWLKGMYGCISLEKMDDKYDQTDYVMFDRYQVCCGCLLIWQDY